MNKRRITAVLFLVLIFMIMCTSVQASSKDDMFPSSGDMGLSSSETPLYEKYDIGNYTFDMEEVGIFDKLNEVWTFLASILFQVHVMLSKAVLMLLISCFKLDLFQIFSNLLDKLIGSLNTSIFTPAMKIAIPITFIVIFFNVALHRVNTAMRMTISVICVLAAAFIFINSPSEFLGKLNEFSESASGEVLSGTAKVVNGSSSSDNAVVNLGNTYWKVVVIRPWQIIEFGNSSAQDAESKTDKILSLSPSDDKRKEIATAESDGGNEAFSKSGQGGRIAKVLVFGLILLVVNAGVLVVSGLTALFQMGAIICALLGIIVFALALLPNFSFQSVEKWLLRTAGFVLYKVAMTTLICIYFAVVTTLYSVQNTYGWFFMSLLQALAIVAIIIFRKEIFGVIQNVGQGEGRLMNSIARERSIGQTMKRAAVKTAVGAYGVKKLSDGIGQYKEQRQDKKLTKEFTPMANDYLTQKYNKEKREVDNKNRTLREKAEEAGEEFKPVEYSDFVKRTDFRMSKGFKPFDEKDINGAIGYMKSLRRQGEDPKALLTTDVVNKSDESIKYKQLQQESEVAATREHMRIRTEASKYRIKKNVYSNQDSNLYNPATALEMARRDRAAKRANKGRISPVSSRSAAAENININNTPANVTEINKVEHNNTSDVATVASKNTTKPQKEYKLKQFNGSKITKDISDKSNGLSERGIGNVNNTTPADKNDSVVTKNVSAREKVKKETSETVDQVSKVNVDKVVDVERNHRVNVNEKQELNVRETVIETQKTEIKTQVHDAKVSTVTELRKTGKPTNGSTTSAAERRAKKVEQLEKVSTPRTKKRETKTTVTNKDTKH